MVVIMEGYFIEEWELLWLEFPKILKGWLKYDQTFR